MNLFRRICLGLVTISPVFLFLERSHSSGIVPFPGDRLWVATRLATVAEKNYFLRVTTPIGSHGSVPAMNGFDCSLAIRVKKASELVLEKNITRFSRQSESPISNTYDYRSTVELRLPKGDYLVEICSYGKCAVTEAKGASIQIAEEPDSDPTAIWLRNSVFWFLSMTCFVSGILGLLFCEIRSATKH